MACEGAVMSCCCDRARSITFGIWGGLPSIPQGLWKNKGRENEVLLGAIFSRMPVRPGDTFVRPSAGGGGLKDPLERDPKRVLEDVIDGYVSVERAGKDYGVIIRVIDEEILDYRVDLETTDKERNHIRENRIAWMREDPHAVEEKFVNGEIDELDVVRRHGVILNWGARAVVRHHLDRGSKKGPPVQDTPSGCFPPAGGGLCFFIGLGTRTVKQPKGNLYHTYQTIRSFR